jgi:hypothetical protein
LYVLLKEQVDWATTKGFWLTAAGTVWKPNVRKCVAKAAAWQKAVDRGMFYVAAEKVGTKHTAGNYWPWTDYFPECRWIRELWRTHKLTHAKTLEYGLKTRVSPPSPLSPPTTLN